MPFQENWSWLSTDQMVLDYLEGGDIAGVTTWQTSDEFLFEFHEGHTTGNPIYIRPTGNTDTSNIPKIDTKNKYAHQYASISDIANDGKLTGALSNDAQQELMNLIQTEWDALKTLATRYWDGEPVNVERKTAEQLWAEAEGGETGQHNEQIRRNQLRLILFGRLG